MNLYKQYAQIKKDLELLQNEESILRDAILQDMRDKKVIKEKFEFGQFTVGCRKSYTYSTKIKDMEDKVTIAKIKEVEKGKAKFKETNYVVYKPVTLE